MWRHAPYRQYLLVRTVEAQDGLSLHQNLTSSQTTIIIRIEVCLHTPMETTSKGAGLEKMGGAARRHYSAETVERYVGPKAVVVILSRTVRMVLVEGIPN